MLAQDPSNQTELVALLTGVAADVTSALDEETLAIAVERAIERIVQVEYSGLFFFDPELGRLRMLYSKGFTEEERLEAERTAMERHPGWVFRSRQVLHVPDVEGDHEQRTSGAERSFTVRSRLHFPVLYRDECVGVFGLASAEPRRFTELHVAALAFLSSMTGVVCSNLRHIRAITAQIEIVRRQRAELRTLEAPVLVIGNGALLLPVIGRVDATRIAHMQEKLLGAIAERRARAVILDLTAMEAAGDDAMAALLRIAKASALMGARCVVSGITSRAATVMARLDVPLRDEDLFGTVETALASVLRDA